MDNNKLISLLRTCSKIELQQLRKYIKSPFFNENEQLVVLFDLLYTKVLNEKTLEKYNKVGIWKELFKNQPFNDTKFRRLFSDLNKLAEDYYAYQLLRSHPFKKLNLQITAHNRDALQKHFNGHIRLIEGKFDELKIQNADFHFASFEAEYEKHLFADRRSKATYKLENLHKADYHLDAYYIIKKLQNHCTFLLYQSLRSLELQETLPDGFLEYAKSSTFSKEPAIKIYLSIIALLSEEEPDKYFKKLEELLENYGESFTKNELREFYFWAQNFCATQINKGKVNYYSELFSIYKAMIRGDLVLSNDLLPFGLYKNISTIGLIVKEFDWTEQFIQDYTPKLPEAHRENALNYNLAKIYFHQNKFEKVIEQLREVEYKNLIYALGGKLMLLKTYYELRETQALESLIDSFRIYLRRNQHISKDVKQQYMNVLRFVKKLSSLAPYDKKGLEKINEQITDSTAVADKKWLLEKVGEMKN